MRVTRTVFMLFLAPTVFVSAIMPITGCVPAATLADVPITDQVLEGIGNGRGKFAHSDFDALLQAHVKKSGRVDYAGLKKDHEKLKGYLEKLAKADLKSLSRDELLAFLINAYNAYTLDLIVRNYPLKSIKEISSPWDTEFCNIGGNTVSLNFIEHKLLRVPELFQEPRIHFAVNCASVGCPLLQNRAFTGDRVEKQLDEATRATLTDSRYVKVSGKKVQVTKILDWFKGDFTKPHGSVAKFLIKYVEKDAKAILEKEGDGAIDHFKYDWDLNDVVK